MFLVRFESVPSVLNFLLVMLFIYTFPAFPLLIFWGTDYLNFVLIGNHVGYKLY